MFIIQGYAFSQKTINTFRDRTIYLESENREIIKLNVKEILNGQMDLTQAILCPLTELKPYTKYYLKYSNQTEKESNEMRHWNSDKKEYEKVFWKTTNKKSWATLSSNLTLEFDKTEVIHYGCGPSAKAIFNIKNKSSSEVWYKTEVIDIKTNKQTTFYIKEWNNRLHVGHGMCAGAFTFHNKGNYKVRFTPSNIDGKSLKATKWFTFDSPFMVDKGQFGN
ncbi:hypothetical protein GCM10007028_28340 [Algibacter mikhailovii]|uniref:Uncharacterized protein n=2 Tax=Algibacter mikhailovii TaxID=425498 RepID=A0A918VDE1_9FLAO|nr:hypothetical protein GCM10007028_28340 [Algibacter mikhailovii]